MTVFIAVALSVATVFLALLGAAVVHRWMRSKRDAHVERVAEELRPRLMQLLAQDAPSIDELLGASDSGETEIDDLFVYRLMTKLGSRDREVLASLLAQRGAFDNARRRMRSSRGDTRARAAEVLGTGDAAIAIPELARLLEDRDRDVRSAAARSIGKLGRANTVPLLMDGLARSRLPLSVVGMAILRLGPDSCAYLRKSMKSVHSVERRLAAECLGLFGDIEAAPALVLTAKHDRVVHVRSAAAKALGQIEAPHAMEFAADDGRDNPAVGEREDLDPSAIRPSHGRRVA